MSDSYIWYIFDGKVRMSESLKQLKDYPVAKYNLVSQDDGVHIISNKNVDYKIQFTLNFFDSKNSILDVKLEEQDNK